MTVFLPNLYCSNLSNFEVSLIARTREQMSICLSPPGTVSTELIIGYDVDKIEVLSVLIM